MNDVGSTEQREAVAAWRALTDEQRRLPAVWVKFATDRDAKAAVLALMAAFAPKIEDR